MGNPDPPGIAGAPPSAPPDCFDKRLAALDGGISALIDLDRLAENVSFILRDLLPPGAGLMAVVKANAYGHGYLPCARTVLEAGATSLAVARIEEALLLRRSGIAAPVLVVGAPNLALVADAARAGVELAVGSLAAVAAMARRLDEDDSLPPVRLHVKVDSGMRRFGVEPADAPALARAIAANPRMRVEGLFTHFATADEEDDSFVKEQVRRFEQARHGLAASGIVPPQIHVANSGAALRHVTLPGVTAIRMGISLYGLSPSAKVPVTPDFRSFMKLRTRIVRAFTLAPGEGLSYGLTWVAPAPTRCATLAGGYADGLSRSLGNRGWAGVKGQRCPIIGRVCMDQVMIDTGAATGVQEGDEAVLIGDGWDGEMTIDQAAALCGTINYEVVCAVAARVPRLYVRGGRPFAIHDLAGYIERS
ncbi:MAG: alanine racemase [Vicinamibacterales bacterium]